MKTFSHFWTFVLLLSLSFAACKKDKTKITVTGLVRDANNAVLAGVGVKSDLDSVSTDANGNYSIEAEKEGSLTFSKGSDYEIKVEMVSGRERIEVTLQASPAKRFADYFTTAGNQVINPSFAQGSVRPTLSNWGSLSQPRNNFFVATTYKGAIDPNGTPWYDGWSFYSRLVAGMTTSAPLPTLPTKVISDADMRGSDTIRWVKDTAYILTGFVFVNDGQVLDIQAGTIIKGRSGTGASASALIIARGGKILAQGTATEPIIFTYEGDNGGSEATLRGQWGGLIVLGKARLNSAPGQTAIEGIPTSETRGLYGGQQDNDNSGIIRYVSIRHSGTNIGADNEINGLTMGGVGSGTVIEYVEVIANDDDGFEWFGGTVNGKYLISAYNQDDSYDYDEGYRGYNQFLIAHQDPTAGAADRGGEHDGGTDPETAQPYALPIFFNATYVGGGNSTRALTFRDNAGGEYHNSIFTNFGRGVDIQDRANQTQDTYKQWEDGNLRLENNIFFNIGAGDRPQDLFRITVN